MLGRRGIPRGRGGTPVLAAVFTAALRYDPAPPIYSFLLFLPALVGLVAATLSVIVSATKQAKGLTAECVLYASQSECRAARLRHRAGKLWRRIGEDTFLPTERARGTRRPKWMRRATHRRIREEADRGIAVRSRPDCSSIPAARGGLLQGRPGVYSRADLLIEPAEEKMGTKKRSTRRHWPSTPAALDALIEEATIDANGVSEQRVGFHTMLDEHLAVPFDVALVGMTVTVERIDVTDDERIVAVCRRGRFRQAISLDDLPIPPSLPGASAMTRAPSFKLNRRRRAAGITRVPPVSGPVVTPWLRMSDTQIFGVSPLVHAVGKPKCFK